MKLSTLLRATAASSAVAIMLVGGIPVAQAAELLNSSPAVESSPSQSSSDKIFVVTVNDGSITEAIAQKSATDADYRDKAKRIVSTWQNKVEGGEELAVEGLQGQPTSTVLAELDALQDKLERDNPTTTSSEPSPTSSAITQGRGSGLPDVSPTPFKQTQQSAVAADPNPSDPNTFRVSGAPAGDRSYWINLETKIEGFDCLGPNGCELADKYSVRTTVNPGTTTSRLDHTASYFPSTGRFKEAHFRQFAVNHGAVTNAVDTASLRLGANTTYLNNNLDLSGSVLTVGLTLWVDAIGYGWVYESGKTADCVGLTSPDKRCFY